MPSSRPAASRCDACLVKPVAPIIEKLNRARVAIEAAARSFAADRWQAPPRPGAWSAAEVIAHVTMVEERVAEGARQLLAGPPAPVPLLKRLHLPVRFAQWRSIRAKTPIPLDPSLVAPREEMLSRLAALRQRTLALLKHNARRDLAVYRMPHPFFGSLNFYDWFRMLAYHELRHTQQIREIVDFFQR
jgi:DinB superfamily